MESTEVPRIEFDEGTGMPVVTPTMLPTAFVAGLMLGRADEDGWIDDIPGMPESVSSALRVDAACLACWYEVRNGTSDYTGMIREKWGEWADDYERRVRAGEELVLPTPHLLPTGE